MAKAFKENRIYNFIVDKNQPTIAAFDLGRSDMTAIWFIQIINGTIKLVDYYEASNEAPADHVQKLFEKNYNYVDIILPHDAAHEKYGAEAIRRQYLDLLPFHMKGMLYVQAKVNLVMTRITLVRGYLPICVFHKERCADGINALVSYQREYDEDAKTYREAPLHNWASHGADAFGEGIRWIQKKYSLNLKAVVGRDVIKQGDDLDAKLAFLEARKKFFGRQKQKLLAKTMK